MDESKHLFIQNPFTVDSLVQFNFQYLSKLIVIICNEEFK